MNLLCQFPFAVIKEAIVVGGGETDGCDDNKPLSGVKCVLRVY